MWTIGEPADPAPGEHEGAGFWRQTREAVAEEPGVELEDHDVLAPALKDGLDHG